eukprot:g4890.t1
MAHLGRRVEVFWPPDGDDTEGTWYQGRLDGYDDTGGTGYHVTYDDGDEEVLGNTVDGRDDVRLLPSEGNSPSPSEAHHSGSPSADMQLRKHGGSRPSDTRSDGVRIAEERRQQNEQNLAQMSYREIKRSVSPRDGDGQEGGGSEYEAEDFGDRDPRNRSTGDSEHTETGAAGRDTPPSHPRHGTAASTGSSAYGCEDGDDFDSGDSGVSNADDDEAGVFGSAFGSGGARGSYRGDDSDGESCGVGQRTSSAGEETEGSAERGSVESFSLTGNSSEWTPLRGTDLVSPSWRQDRSEDWFSRSAPHGKALSPCVEGAAAATTEACISALRRAVDAAANNRDGTGEGVLTTEGARESPYGPSGLGEKAIGSAAEVGRTEDGLRALGSFVHGTALLEGTVDGVERGGQRGTVMSDGAAVGVFVKVSFIDGGGGDGLASTANDAMFRCKTLLHTTGSGPATPGSGSGGGGGGGGGWLDGKFQCETFHGGRLEELASAAVLFSAHRRAQGKGSGGNGASGLKRAGEGYLGQVILPLRGLLNNLRPVMQPIGDRPDHDGGGNNTGTRGGKLGKRDHDYGHGRGGGGGNKDGEGKKKDERSGGSWQSLRGELGGVFPAADRRGRVSVSPADGVAAGRTSPTLRLRLRLSISLNVKTPECLPGQVDSQNHTDAHVLGTRPAAAAAPYASVGAAWCEPTPQGGSGAATEKTKRYHSQRHADGGGSRRPGGVRTTPAARRTRKNSDRAGGGGGNASIRHGAALARQRRERQEQIARENERMERRLKHIREAAPNAHAPHHHHSPEKAPVSGGGGAGAPRAGREQGHRPRRRVQEQAPRPDIGLNSRAARAAAAAAAANAWDITPPPGLGGGCDGHRGDKGEGRHGRVVSTDSKKNSNSNGNGNRKSAAEGQREAEWREVYREREALAAEAERAAAETASLRSRVEALRAKTLWTEANARSASLAVVSLERALDRRGRGEIGRQRAKTAALAAASGGGGGVLVPVELDIDGVVEEGLAAELRRQEELYKALVEARRTAVTAGEEARLRREADLEELDGLRARLAQAEARQDRHRWRQQHDEEEGGSPSAQEPSLPKDALERAQDLALALRVEVETLRLMAKTDGGAGTEHNERGEGAGTGTGEGAEVAATSRAVREAQEEVDSLKARLESKSRRLEAATFDRDAIRAEYQVG